MTRFAFVLLSAFALVGPARADVIEPDPRQPRYVPRHVHQEAELSRRAAEKLLLLQLGMGAAALGVVAAFRFRKAKP